MSVLKIVPGIAIAVWAGNKAHLGGCHTRCNQFCFPVSMEHLQGPYGSRQHRHPTGLMCPFRQEDVQHLIGWDADVFTAVAINKFVVAWVFTQ